MSCPNCSQQLNQVAFDNQNILHCGNCGSSFFEENGINRITTSTAKKLAADKKVNLVVGKERHCPKDNTPLEVILDDEAIPNNVTLVRCPTCSGIFTYAEDLVRFKQAQSAKINFFKLWNKPLPSLKMVLLFGFLALFMAPLLIIGSSGQKNITQSKAHDLISKVNISTSNRYLFVSFRTQLPMLSEIRFIDKTSKTQIIKTISEKPVLLHYLTTTDINLSNELYYQITLTDTSGKKTMIEEQKITIK